MTLRRDPHTKDLFAWNSKPVRVGYSDEVLGHGDLSSQISRAIGHALDEAKDRGMCRNDVARKIAEFLGRGFAKGTLDKLVAPASEDRHFPLDAFIALIHVTGERKLLGFIPEMFGCVVVDEQYVELIELHELEEHERAIAARRSALEAKLRRRK